MTYVPVSDALFARPIEPGSLAALCDNDWEAFAAYSPGLEVNPNPAATTAARDFRFMWLGNQDQAQLTVGVRAAASSGSKDVFVQASGVGSNSVAVTTDAWYSAAFDCHGPEQEVRVFALSPSPQTLSFRAIRLRTTPAAAVAGTLYASGYRRLDRFFFQTLDQPIPSEQVSRLRANPCRIAIDRPVCVFAHASDTIKAVSGKSLDVWGAEDSTAYSRVGRFIVPRCDIGERWFRCYAYTTETTPGVATFAVRVGSQEERWTGPGWHSWRIKAGHGPHQGWANVLPGSSNAAAIRSLLVWRSEL